VGERPVEWTLVRPGRCAGGRRAAAAPASIPCRPMAWAHPCNRPAHRGAPLAEAGVGVRRRHRCGCARKDPSVQSWGRGFGAFGAIAAVAVVTHFRVTAGRDGGRGMAGRITGRCPRGRVICRGVKFVHSACKWSLQSSITEICPTCNAVRVLPVSAGFGRQGLGVRPAGRHPHHAPPRARPMPCTVGCPHFAGRACVRFHFCDRSSSGRHRSCGRCHGRGSGAAGIRSRPSRPGAPSESGDQPCAARLRGP
jgi:hypothetical protein